MTSRTCRACSTRLADGLLDDRHPLCRLDPPPTVDEVRTAIEVLDDVLGIEVLGGIEPAGGEGPVISNRAHGRDPDYHHAADRRTQPRRNRAHPPDQLVEE